MLPNRPRRSARFFRRLSLITATTVREASNNNRDILSYHLISSSISPLSLPDRSPSPSLFSSSADLLS